MSTTKLETKVGQVCKDFECGLASDNVEEASNLIGKGEARLKISIYLWGSEFDVVQDGAARRSDGGKTRDGM